MGVHSHQVRDTEFWAHLGQVVKTLPTVQVLVHILRFSPVKASNASVSPCATSACPFRGTASLKRCHGSSLCAEYLDCCRHAAGAQLGTTQRMDAIVSYWMYAGLQNTRPEPETCMRLQVDMTWSGHVHVYERTCPILFHECLGYTAAGIPNAPVHMAIGNGGVSP